MVRAHARGAPAHAPLRQHRNSHPPPSLCRTMQIPPTTGLLYYDYALFDVYVQSSTTVFAVGGNLNNPSATVRAGRDAPRGRPRTRPFARGGGPAGHSGLASSPPQLAGADWTLTLRPPPPSPQAFTDETDPYPAAGTPAVQRQPSMYIGPGFGNGIIVLSVNSGANWQQMTYPGMTYGNAPAFTCITFNNGVGWVGGYVYKPGPLLNILGQYEFLPNNDAVTATYPVNGTIAPFQTIGLSYTVLITLDQRTWTPAPSASFPPGFIEQGTAGTPQVYNARVQAQQDVMGIEWDNSLNGWMYGTGSEDKSGFILSTRDGGNTWRYETPQDVLANGLDVRPQPARSPPAAPGGPSRALLRGLHRPPRFPSSVKSQASDFPWSDPRPAPACLCRCTLAPTCPFRTEVGVLSLRAG